MQLAQELLDILVCPACKGSLVTDEAALLCEACRLRYPVRNGIPVMLVDEADKIDL